MFDKGRAASVSPRHKPRQNTLNIIREKTKYLFDSFLQIIELKLKKTKQNTRSI